MDRLHVLLVDDSAEESGPIRQLLESFGEEIRTTWVTEAEETCRRLAEEDFDLILLDLTLPDEWGLDGLVRITATAQGTPVLALAMPEDEELARHAVIAGASGFLLKPEIVGEELLPLIRSLAGKGGTSVDSPRVGDPEGRLLERDAFLDLSKTYRQLAKATGKSLILFTGRLESGHDEEVPDEETISASALILALSFRMSDALGHLGGGRFAALALVHPSDDSDEILSRRFDEVLSARNQTTHRDRPIRIARSIERIDPEIPIDELARRIDPSEV